MPTSRPARPPTTPADPASLLSLARKVYRRAVATLATVGVDEAALRAMAQSHAPDVSVGPLGTPWRALSEARRRYVFELLDADRYGLDGGRKRADGVEYAVFLCRELDVTWEALARD